MTVRTLCILLKNAKSGGSFSKNISFTRRPLEEEESVQGDKTETKRKKPPRSTVKLTLRVSGKNVNQNFRDTRCNSSFLSFFLYIIIIIYLFFFFNTEPILSLTNPEN